MNQEFFFINEQKTKIQQRFNYIINIRTHWPALINYQKKLRIQKSTKVNLGVRKKKNKTCTYSHTIFCLDFKDFYFYKNCYRRSFLMFSFSRNTYRLCALLYARIWFPNKMETRTLRASSWRSSAHTVADSINGYPNPYREC